MADERLKQYTRVADLILDLIDGEVSASPTYHITESNFNGAALSNYANNQKDFYDGVLTFLHNESTYLPNKYYGVRQTFFPLGTEGIDYTSVVEWINSNCDLSDNLIDKTSPTYLAFRNNTLYQLQNNELYAFQENVLKKHWNESLAKLYSLYADNWESADGEIHFLDNLVTNSGGIIKSGGPINFRMDGILKGDAGNYFGDEEGKIDYVASLLKSPDQEVKTWVRSWFNIDGDTYGGVRNTDKLVSTLNSKNNLQFTRYKEKVEDYLKKDNGQLSAYLRLIMPMYERIVEIEDLDRNFWVISQVLSALGAFVLGDDSPLPKLLLGMTDEIAQLWENVFYLWLNFAAKKQEEHYSDLQTLFIPINYNDLQDHIKFDTIYDTKIVADDQTSIAQIAKNLKTIWETKLSYLKGLYNKSNLIIIPEMRGKVYYKNQYAKVYYPGAIIYNRNTDRASYIVFKINEATLYEKLYLWPDFNGDRILTKEDANIALGFYALTQTADDETIYKSIYGINDSDTSSYWYKYIKNSRDPYVSTGNTKDEKIIRWLRQSCNLEPEIDAQKGEMKLKEAVEGAEINAVLSSNILTFVSYIDSNDPEKNNAKAFKKWWEGDASQNRSTLPVFDGDEYKGSIAPVAINLQSRLDAFVGKVYPFYAENGNVYSRPKSFINCFNEKASKDKRIYSAAIRTIPHFTINNKDTLSVSGALEFKDVCRSISDKSKDYSTICSWWFQFKEPNSDYEVCVLTESPTDKRPPGSSVDTQISGVDFGECVSYQTII